MSKYVIKCSSWLLDRRTASFRQMKYLASGYCFTAASHWIQHCKSQEAINEQNMKRYEQALASVKAHSKGEAPLVKRHLQADTDRKRLKDEASQHHGELKALIGINSEAANGLNRMADELRRQGGVQTSPRTHDDAALSIAECHDHLRILARGNNAILQKMDIAYERAENGPRKALGTTTVCETYLSIAQENGLTLTGGIEGIRDGGLGRSVFSKILPGTYFLYNLLDEGGKGGHTIAGYRTSLVREQGDVALPACINVFDPNTGLSSCTDGDGARLFDELHSSYLMKDDLSKFAFPRWSLYLAS